MSDGTGAPTFQPWVDALKHYNQARQSGEGIEAAYHTARQAQGAHLAWRVEHGLSSAEELNELEQAIEREQSR